MSHWGMTSLICSPAIPHLRPQRLISCKKINKKLSSMINCWLKNKSTRGMVGYVGLVVLIVYLPMYKSLSGPEGWISQISCQEFCITEVCEEISIKEAIISVDTLTFYCHWHYIGNSWAGGSDIFVSTVLNVCLIFISILLFHISFSDLLRLCRSSGHALFSH